MADSILNIEALVSVIMEKLEPLIAEKLRTITPEPGPAQPEIMTRKQVAELLGISLPTLHDRIQTGTLKAYRQGSRVYFKRREVLEALTKIRTR